MRRNGDKWRRKSNILGALRIILCFLLGHYGTARCSLSGAACFAAGVEGGEGGLLLRYLRGPILFTCSLRISLARWWRVVV